MKVRAFVRGEACDTGSPRCYHQDPAWSERDGLLIRLADELHDSATIAGPLWASLTEQFSEDLLLELIITAGWYRLLSYVINAAAIEREPWAERFPSA